MMQKETDGLVERARERAEAAPVPEGWGYRVALEEGESFVGRWRGETVDELNDRRVFLLWDADDERCFSREYAALAREVDRERPERGATVAIYRGDNYRSAQGEGFSFGIVSEPNEQPLPDDEPAGGDGIPF